MPVEIKSLADYVQPGQMQQTALQAFQLQNENQRIGLEQQRVQLQEERLKKQEEQAMAQVRHQRMGESVQRLKLINDLPLGSEQKIPLMNAEMSAYLSDATGGKRTIPTGLSPQTVQEGYDLFQQAQAHLDSNASQPINPQLQMKIHDWMNRAGLEGQAKFQATLQENKRRTMVQALGGGDTPSPQTAALAAIGANDPEAARQLALEQVKEQAPSNLLKMQIEAAKNQEAMQGAQIRTGVLGKIHQQVQPELQAIQDIWGDYRKSASNPNALKALQQTGGPVADFEANRSGKAYQAKNDVDTLRDQLSGLQAQRATAILRREPTAPIDAAMSSLQQAIGVAEARRDFYGQPSDSRLRTLRERVQNVQRVMDESSMTGQQRAQAHADQAQSYLQTAFLHQLKPDGSNVNEAARIAADQTGKIYPGVPIDPMKLQNLAGKGQTTVNLTLPTSTRAEAYGSIQAADSALNSVSKLREIVQQNPTAMGMAGAIQRTIAGAGQQLHAVFGTDPAAREFLNTKPADEFDAWKEILVFHTARALNGHGVLTEPDVRAARSVVGVLNKTDGPDQLLNKLSVIEDFANSNKARAESLLQGGASREPAKGKATGPSTAEDFLKSIGVAP